MVLGCIHLFLDCLCCNWERWRASVGFGPGLGQRCRCGGEIPVSGSPAYAVHSSTYHEELHCSTFEIINPGALLLLSLKLWRHKCAAGLIFRPVLLGACKEQLLGIFQLPLDGLVWLHSLYAALPSFKMVKMPFGILLDLAYILQRS